MTMAADYFDLLGQPRMFALERDALEAAYLERAAAAHPDRVVGGSVGQQREAMEASTSLNQAYRSLRDPVRRAEYLVKLGGVDLDSSDPKCGAPHMPQTFLLEMIDRREQISEAQERGPAAIDVLRDDVETELDAVFQRAVAAIEREAFQDAAQDLVVRRYLQRILDEIDDEEG